jgi:Flp pilus assembly secretin CpaC
MQMTTSTRLTRALALIAALGSILAWSAAARAAEAPQARVAISMRVGQTYVIKGIDAARTPAVKVVDNPHALVVHAEQPGRVVLLGAEAGRWDVTVTRDDGRTVTYQVTVAAVAPPLASLKAGTSPPAIEGSGAAEAAAPVAVPLDETAAAAPKPASEAAAGTSSRNVSAPSSPRTPVSSGAASDIAQIPTQRAQDEKATVTRGAQYRTNPSILQSGQRYWSDAIDGGRHYLPADALWLMSGTSSVIDFHRRLVRVSIADSKIADIQVINPFQINVVGHKPGFTTLAVWDDQGNYQERQVRVDASGRQQVMLNCIVAELNRTGLENQGIDFGLAFPKLNISLVSLPGKVATPFSQSTGASTQSVLSPGGQLTNLLLSQNLTYALAAQNSDVVSQSFFQFLEQHNLGRILAEPHLLANSGEQAKFLSGGEIPIVIAQALNTSIVFKQYGTSVEFLPTVIGRNDIELLVKPEVSEPDFTSGVQLFGFNVPAFVVRRAETLVRLKDNQTLIIAGLILHNRAAIVNKVPYLGDLPYLGSIFRNTSWQKQDTDLVFTVTPQIVTPLPRGAQVYEPTSRGPLSRDEIKTRALSPYDVSRPRF